MNEVGYYTYGVIRNGPIGVSLAGVDKKENIFTVPFDGLVCVVSCVSLDEFGEAALKKNLESLDWVRDKAFSHERVIEDVMKRTTIIPMKFCTIFNNTDRILELLKEKYDYFMELLVKLEDKHEWGIKVYCRKNETAEVKNPASGRDYLMAKRAHEEEAQEEERNVNAHVEEIYRNIRPAAEEVRVNRPTPKELIQDKNRAQVLNVSLLVSDNKTEELTILVDDLAKLYSKDGLTLELVGPLPIYSFVGGELDADNE